MNMKRIFVFVIGLITMCFMSSVALGQSLSKSDKKAVKALAKEYAADGFKSTSMAYTMEEKIAEYRSKLKANPDLVEIVEDGKGASSFSAEMAAQNAAAIKYATCAGSIIKGGMERAFGNMGEEYDKIHGNYVQNVAEFIMPLLKKYMLFSKREGGSYIVRVGYLLEENSAKKAREKAFDATIENLANGHVFGEKVRKYVDEMVNPSQQ